MKHLLEKHWNKEDGASLVEFAVVISLFLLVFFAILDFGRLGFNYVMTEKAMQRAARIAVVRPPVCTGVPTTHDRDPASNVRFGTLCRVGNVCAATATQSCILGTDTSFDCSNGAQSTAEEIWCTLEPILPSNASPENFRLSYSFDPNLGFVGGPYTPMVEVAVVTSDDQVIGGEALNFQFVTPLGGLAGLLGGSINNINDDNQISFPNMSVSLPGEDLAQGMDG